MNKLNDKYNHIEVEANKNQKWVDNRYFQDHDLSKEPFCIVIPPPNVTGRLHLGHAWDTTLQDVIIRYKKLQGFDTLWLPGMDHAGIATQAKVDEQLRAQGTSAYELGREKFLEQAWTWKEDYAGFIRSQWGKLGLGLDYSRERFTLDEGLNKAVTKVFVDLYNKGQIYRKERIINWDPAAKTALSNIEVDHIEIQGNEHYFKYYFVDNPTEYLEIMTTRPETMFGDGAIAVNPEDTRYQKHLGREVYVPLSKIKIPVIFDDYVSMDFGSGCVKITPAHDPNDFHVGVRHNIPFRVIMNDDATMASNEWVVKAFQGLDRYSARKLFIEKADLDGTLVKVVPIMHSVGHSQRSGAVVEPLLSMQWFVDMQEMAQDSIKYQNTDDKIDFYPERFEKTFIQWMENVEDWCISRQLWWGHQIPAWYHKTTKEIYVGTTPPSDIENYTQDEDVLDTWFSSGLWAFSTLGWPDKTNDFERYYPNNTLVSGYDIIFFWIARMIFTSLEFLDEKPFNDVLIHGLVRDEQGRKMSKSLGNGVDPMDVIEKFGADSLRYFLSTNSSPGQDLRYSEEKVEATYNFINKLWNASRFVMINIDETTTNEIDINELALADQWILFKLNQTIKEVTTNMDKYEFTIVSNTLYNFIWDDYCSWYLEMAKASIDTKATKQVLKYVLEAILKMLNPFMPFVTEEIFMALTNKETIILEEYPLVNTEYDFTNIEDINIAMELISKFREIRQEYSLKRAIQINYDLENNISSIEKYISKITNFEVGISKDASKIETFILSNSQKVMIDLSMVKVKSNDEFKQEYEKQLKQIDNEIKRCVSMLNNEKFISKAPAAKIEEENKKLSDYQAQYASIEKLLNEL